MVHPSYRASSTHNIYFGGGNTRGPRHGLVEWEKDGCSDVDVGNRQKKRIRHPMVGC